MLTVYQPAFFMIINHCCEVMVPMCLGRRLRDSVCQLAVPGSSPRPPTQPGGSVCGLWDLAIRHGRGAGGQPLPHVVSEEKIRHRWHSGHTLRLRTGYATLTQMKLEGLIILEYVVIILYFLMIISSEIWRCATFLFSIFIKHFWI